MLVAPAVFADEPLSTFNLQGDLDYPEPFGKESYFATQVLSFYRFYMGISAGANMTSLNPKISETTTDTQENELNKKTFGYAGTLYGGLGASYSNFYIGAELSGSYNTLNKKINTLYNEIKITQPIVGGIDLIPGLLTYQKDFLLYGRVGMGGSLFKFKLNNDSGANTQEFAFGWRAGVGMEYFINDSFSMRIEYLFTKYDDIKESYKPQKSKTNYTYELSSPSANQVNLGLTINF